MMLTRIVTRFLFIRNTICFKYVIGGGDAENGKSIKQLYGSQRKVEDQKVSSNLFAVRHFFQKIAAEIPFS